MFRRRSELEKVVAVAEAGKIVAAAHRLAMTQPALTRAIARLECRFGAPLFERLPTGVRPTALGATVIEQARRLLRAFEDTEDRIGGALAGRSGCIRATADALWMQAVLPEAVGRSSIERRAAQPVSRTTRLSPALARTFVPGSSTEPRALRVMFRTLRSSSATVWALPAISRET